MKWFDELMEPKDPDSCAHPAEMLLWRDSSLHCFKCRKTWHESPFPKHAGKPKIWGRPELTIEKTESVVS